MTENKKRVPWFLWPFAALWRLVSTIVEMTGRLLSLIIGLVFILVGILLTLTVIGAIVGIPLALVGVLLFVRGIF
ncbi:MAG: hypothetical protein JXA13_03005 [Anaerolineales bacterium]|nr:hypothetical protein [Anaerolineales bacterium]